ncbi:MAG: hypothetical protein AB1690_12705 [Candidatus Zixiibacteriota bacterium]
MAENEQKAAEKKGIDPDVRFRYLGFDYQPGKIGELFKSEEEKKSWVQRIMQRRQRGAGVRDECTLMVPRVAPYEKIVLTVTSVLLVLSLFFPWFSGYKEFQVEQTPTEQQALTDDSGAGGTETPQKDERGFASISAAKKKVEIRKEYASATALGAFGYLGDVLSSGFILMLTGILFLIYMLLCIGLAAYTLYALYGVKGDPDTKAVKLKKILRWNWIPVAIWGFCLIISFFGADYSFNTANTLVQIDKSYGIGTYLGILSYGFYITLFAFIMNAVKAIEI